MSACGFFGLFWAPNVALCWLHDGSFFLPKKSSLASELVPLWFADSSVLKTLRRFGSCHALQDIDYMRYTYLNCLRFEKSEYHVFFSDGPPNQARSNIPAAPTHRLRRQVKGSDCGLTLLPRKRAQSDRHNDFMGNADISFWRNRFRVFRCAETELAAIQGGREFGFFQWRRSTHLRLSCHHAVAFVVFFIVELLVILVVLCIYGCRLDYDVR